MTSLPIACPDCGRNDFASINAMMRCMCWLYDKNRREKHT